jgi:hypothetical protein
MKGERTIWITLLAVLAGIAGIFAVIDTLRYLGLLPVSITTVLGEYSFVYRSWFSALLSGIVAAIWFWAAARIWAVDPQGWLFAVVIAVVNLIFLGMGLIAGTPFNAMVLPLTLNALALILGLLPSTRAAFGQG